MPEHGSSRTNCSAPDFCPGMAVDLCGLDGRALLAGLASALSGAGPGYQVPEHVLLPVAAI